MTYYSKKALVSLTTNIIVFISFYPNVLRQMTDLNASSTEVSKFWAEFLVILLVANIVIKIVMMIIFKIVHSFFSNESEPRIVDERDQFIELKAVRNLCFTFTAGFFSSLLAVIFDQPLETMFKILAYTFLLSGIILEGSYIFYYEREA
ncbi:hypothetical protein DOK67_0001976 [Enterococcus sp. DIV0212c]|uniref:hypothetical protein n=1 Tax=Enterococcus sp. DIV0212c TaxID=2230867 RepID=UPI001A9B5534|nr:hypothetical protein [Enterococcus sp. DIV0212c]MBO1355384.1 hypothetical protein [Enterococcus sp. DIV0212c]